MDYQTLAAARAPRWQLRIQPHAICNIADILAISRLSTRHPEYQRKDAGCYRSAIRKPCHRSLRFQNTKDGHREWCQTSQAFLFGQPVPNLSWSSERFVHSHSKAVRTIINAHVVELSNLVPEPSPRSGVHASGLIDFVIAGALENSLEVFTTCLGT